MATGDELADRSLARDTAAITALNALSRVTGFARVLAVGAALGATALGDTYQGANLVSNILFELLAGGLLSAVLVPTFVGLLDAGRRADAARLAAVLTSRVVLALAGVVAVAMLAARPIMELIVVGVDNAAIRDAQVDLGAFLLLFFLPQVVLYAVGAVATALLQADRRFVAAALAPVCNNIVVIVTMIVFRAMRDGRADLDLSTGEKLVLALGTTGGVVAMTLAPLLAARAGGLVHRLRRGGGSPVPLRPIVRDGVWAAGHLGANQVLVAVTIVVAAAAVDGGVVAYQIAFTFFLLPHAVLANPVFTALYPRVSSDAAAGRRDAVAADAARGLRLTAFCLLPAAALIAAAAAPLLDVVRLGNLDAAGADLVGSTLAAYAAGLLGYSAYFLLTRVSYALGDARTPTTVLAVTTALAVAAMLVAGGATDGTGTLVALGLVHAVAQTGASVVLLGRVRARLGTRLQVAASVTRSLVGSALAGLVAWGLVEAVSPDSRTTAAGAVVGAGALGVAVYAGWHVVTRSGELDDLRAMVRA